MGLFLVIVMFGFVFFAPGRRLAGTTASK